MWVKFGRIGGYSVGIKIIFIMINKWVDDVPKLSWRRKTGAEVSINSLGFAAKCIGIFDTTSSNGFGKA